MNTMQATAMRAPAQRVFPRAAETKKVRLGYVAAVLLCLIAACVQNYVGALAAMGFALTAGVVQNGRLAFGRLSVAFGLLALFVVARSLLPSQLPMYVQLEEALRYLAFAFFATAVARMRIAELVLAASLWIVIIALPYPAYLYFDAFSIADSAGAVRYSSILPHANHLGYVAGAILIGLSYLHFAKVTAVPRYWLLAFLGVALVVASRSSGGVIFVVVGLSSLPLAMGLSRRTVLLAVLGAIAVALLMFSPLGEAAMDKLLNFDLRTVTQKAQRYQFGNQGSSFAWRLSYWLAMIDANIASGPLYTLFGQGGGATGLSNRVFSFMNKDPHSDIVRLFVEFGAIGLVLVLFAFIKVCLASRTPLIAGVILFTPMLTGNSLTSSPVILVLIIMLVALDKGFLRKTT